MTDEVKFKQECFEKRFYSFGTAKIFEKRVEKYDFRLKAITFLGLLTPIILGGFVAAFSTDSEALKYLLLPVCGVLTIIQSVLSLLSLVYKWDDVYSYAISSVKNNTRLTNDFDQLSKESPAKIKRDMSRLRDEFNRQEIEDTAQSISIKEKRFAMRHTLFQYKNKCETCKIKPISLTPSTCDTCGNF
ncbi:mobilome CxxCx(11)CxxC protein [Agarivorans sp. QJM3NY_25]|uniref:mobilome CxxCx(11)CxxC protein n=1 Tax=Agarivorans sp. QJM3NY_25 TaxID=3421430 RepID=UPI003D7C9AB0